MPSGHDIDSAEALSWLEKDDGKDRTISEDSETFLGAEEALRLVRELYAAGATEVVAQGVTVEYEFEDANSLKVMLPNDPRKRAALFVIEARVLREMGSPFDPEGSGARTLSVWVGSERRPCSSDTASTSRSARSKAG